MPIVLKPNQMYYKDPDTGDYKEINVLAEEATATKLAEINAAGANEVTKVQNAGTTEKNKVDTAGATQLAAIQTKADEVTSQLASAGEPEGMLAEAFSPSTNYTAGQYVIQSVTVGGNTVNKLFRFTSDHAAGEWIGTDAVEIKLGDDVTDLKSFIGPTETTSTASTGYLVDRFLIYNGKLYQVTARISAGDTLIPGTNITPISSLSYAVYLLKRFAETTLAGRIDNLESILAQPYTAGDDYVAGEYVFHNHDLYACKYGIQSAGEFNNSQWTKITETADTLNYMYNRISMVLQLALQANDGYVQAMAMVAPAFSESNAYSAGDSVTYNGILYTFTANHAAGAWIGTDAATIPGGVTGEVADLKSAFKAHADTVDALSLFVNYNDIASFTLTPAAIEIGNATASVTLAWTFYATPASLTLNGVSKSVSSSGETVTATDDGSTHQVTYTLATSIGSKTEAFHFYPNLYWGVSSTAGSPTSAFVIGLASKQLSGSKAKTFTVNAGSGQYIYFCSPVRYGQCAFKSGGFEGGFEAAQTVSVTNASGHTENYYVYRSTNPGLGSTTITVS